MQRMDPATWAKAKGPAYVGTQVVGTICVVLLITFTVLRIANPSYEPIIDPITIAIGCIALTSLGKKLDKSSDNDNRLRDTCSLRHWSK